MDVRRLDDPARFLGRAGPLLLEDETRHNLMLGIAGTLRDDPSVYAKFGLWLAEEGTSVEGAAMRTPPYNLIIARPRSDAALLALANGIDDDPPGVIGALPEAERFAEAWSSRTGAKLKRIREQGVFQLDRVVPVTGVSGQMRDAGAADRPLLVEWWSAFATEALGETPRVATAEAVDHRLAAETGGVVLWVDGEPVCFASYGNPTPNGIRIGPVYTPPDRRRHGYASALTAGLSERLLRRYRFCFLFTDLANPTSNKIYEQIGYRRVCDGAEIAFS
jgi:GNAT superfamily N-acetyltransferase